MTPPTPSPAPGWGSAPAPTTYTFPRALPPPRPWAPKGPAPPAGATPHTLTAPMGAWWGLHHLPDQLLHGGGGPRGWPGAAVAQEFVTSRQWPCSAPLTPAPPQGLPITGLFALKIWPPQSSPSPLGSGTWGQPVSFPPFIATATAEPTKKPHVSLCGEQRCPIPPQSWGAAGPRDPSGIWGSPGIWGPP